MFLRERERMTVCVGGTTETGSRNKGKKNWTGYLSAVRGLMWEKVNGKDP